jgi:hypothetical protein
MDPSLCGPLQWLCTYCLLTNKKAETVGKEMVQILSTAVNPEVLQSDDGGEFLEECVRMIRKHFDTIRIVKGKARKPSTQESVERSNAQEKLV